MGSPRVDDDPRRRLQAGQVLRQQALEIIGQPSPGGMGFQPSATELKHDIVWLDTMINYIIGVAS